MSVIEFVFGPRGSWVLDFVDPIFDVASLVRVDGSVIRVVARQVAWSHEQQGWLDGFKLSALATLPPEHLRDAAAPRFFFFGATKDGVRYMVDAAADVQVVALATPAHPPIATRLTPRGTLDR